MPRILEILYGTIKSYRQEEPTERRGTETARAVPYDVTYVTSVPDGTVNLKRNRLPVQ